jgi:hypothetical protein
MVTAETLTLDEIREFRDALPPVSSHEFQTGGAPGSPARWHRICHVALVAANAGPERQAIADEINRRATDTRGYGYTPPVEVAIDDRYGAKP